MAGKKPQEIRLPRWYFGGLASGLAACVTHPLDLLKVQMQTQKGKNISMVAVAGQIVKTNGVIGLYNGISASLLRQLTYSLARFGIYDVGKQLISTKEGVPLPFFKAVSLAAFGGFSGGVIGNPADLVNVRMQNDLKLPPEQRRNYKNALHGIYRVAVTEGVSALWAGGSMTCCRATLMTIGQVAGYDQIKRLLISTSLFADNVFTHITSSFLAGGVAITLTQPVDVLKTRLMNAKPGEITSVAHLLSSTTKEGPLALYKGYIPGFVRVGPHTILLFVIFEQLRLRYGIIKNKAPQK